MYKRVPAELGKVIATTEDGRDITRPYTFELEEYRDERLRGALDWGVYDRILMDDQVKSCLEQRRSAVVSREWSVLSGEPGDARADEAAAAMEDNLQAVGWDSVTDKMLRAPFYGIAVAELMWGAWNGRIGWVQKGKARPIHVRHARRFRYDKDGRLRLITAKDVRGEILPERKFWVVTAGADDDDQPYGRGLAEWLYWPTLFKRNGIRFWNRFLDKFSVPTAKGSYPAGTSEEDIRKLLAALDAIANDAGVVVPEGMAIELLTIAGNGVDFEKMPKAMDEAIARIILSQTMTTMDGASLSQAQVHGGVKQELITADADLLTESFTAGPARWWTDLNYGADVAAPIVTRQVEEEEDLKTTAETDAALSRIGWRRTEESAKDVYGDGFERAEAPPPPGAEAGEEAEDDRADRRGRDANVVPLKRSVSFAEARPRTLYVHRRLKNAADLIAWARRQGFAATMPAKDMHVTIAYSRRPVNWFEMGQAWSSGDGSLTVPPGGPRRVEPLGDQGAIVLLFACGDLEWRNKEMREAGASWDFDEYRPHVTLTYAGGDIDLDAVEPYRGKLVFGPEIFEEIDENWADDRQEASFAEALAAGDVVDDAVNELMADEGWREAIDPLLAPLLEELSVAAGPEEVEAILARAAEANGEQAMIDQLAQAGLALRLAGETEANAQ